MLPVFCAEAPGLTYILLTARPPFVRDNQSKTRPNPRKIADLIKRALAFTAEQGGRTWHRLLRTPRGVLIYTQLRGSSSTTVIRISQTLWTRILYPIVIYLYFHWF